MKAQFPPEIEALLDKDIEVTDELIEKYRRMIWNLTRKFTTDDFALMKDLYQEGCIGLMQACDQYVNDRGTKLGSYIYSRARAKMQQYMQYKHDVVHIPRAHKDDYDGHMVHLDEFADSYRVDHYPLLVQALDELDEFRAGVLRKHFFEGYIVAGLAAEYGVSRSTIDEAIESGLAQIRAALGVWKV